MSISTFCVNDGVFEPAADTNNVPDEAPSVSFHAALGLDAAAFADVQARVRTRVLRTFVKRGLIDKDDATGTAARCGDGARSCRRPASADFCDPRRAPPSPGICGRCCWRASMRPCH